MKRSGESISISLRRESAGHFISRPCRFFARGKLYFFSGVRGLFEFLADDFYEYLRAKVDGVFFLNLYKWFRVQVDTCRARSDMPPFTRLIVVNT